MFDSNILMYWFVDVGSNKIESLSELTSLKSLIRAYFSRVGLT